MRFSLREFSEAKKKRELEKDPEVRFQRFARAAHVTVAPTSTNYQVPSGGASVRLGKGKSSKGRGLGRGAVLPAWMSEHGAEQEDRKL